MITYEDLEAVDNLSQRDRLVVPPLLDSCGTLDEDDEVVVCAFVMDLGQVVVAGDHCEAWDFDVIWYVSCRSSVEEKRLLVK